MSKKNLTNPEAIVKLREVALSVDFALLASRLNQQPFHVIPMSTKQVDGQGRIWFLSGKDSNHNQHIQEDDAVQLLYSHPGKMQFLTVYGTARIVTEQSKLKDLYGSSDDMWFEGLDDPNLTAICVEPEESHYWDPKSNQLVTLFKMGAGVLTGDQPDVMDQGSLKL